MWVALPCLVVGAVVPPLSPNALSECFPQEWLGGRGQSSTAPAWCPSGAWVAAGGLSHGESLGAQWVGRQGQRGLEQEMSRGAVEQCRGTSASLLHLEIWSQPPILSVWISLL